MGTIWNILMRATVCIIFARITYQTDLACVTIDKCPSVLNLVEKHKYSPEIMNFLRTFRCLYSHKAGLFIWCPEMMSKTDKSIDDRIYYEESGRFFLPSEVVVVKPRKVKETRPVSQSPGFLWIGSGGTVTNTIASTTKETSLKDKFSPTLGPDEHTKVTDLSGNRAFPPIKRHAKSMGGNNHDDDIDSKPDDDKIGSNILEALSATCGMSFFPFGEPPSRNHTAELGEFPWMALLEYDLLGKVVPGCAGAVISSRHILTSASCVHAESLLRRKLGQIFQVVLGKHASRTGRDCVKLPFGERCGDVPVILAVESFTVHENFDRIPGQNDVAILKLEKEVIFSDYIKPICVPGKEFGMKENQKLLVPTWQKDENSKNYILMKSEVEAVGQKISPIEDSGLCTGFPGNPLILQKSTEMESKSFLVGIDPVGLKSNTCGQLENPSVSVADFRDWIIKNLN